MILICLIVVSFMFVGFTLRFVVLPSMSSGLRNAVVASELFKVYGKLFKMLDPPPLPSLFFLFFPVPSL